MSVAIGQDFLTLSQLAESTARDGSLVPIARVLQRVNGFMQDIPFVTCNNGMSHKVGQERSLPSGAWRRLNEGILGSESTEQYVEETCGELAIKSEIDDSLMSAPNGAAMRLSKDLRKIEGLGNQLENAFFYETTSSNPERILGLTPRLNSKTGPWNGQIVDFNDLAAVDGTANKTSMWIVGWGPSRVYGIVPPGFTAGLEQVDMGRVPLQGLNGGSYPGWQKYFKHHVGLCIEDARYVVRVCNIDATVLLRTGKVLLDALTEGIHRLPDAGQNGYARIYGNRVVRKYLQFQASDRTTQSTYQEDNPLGRLFDIGMGIDFRLTDGISNTESKVT
jgi:hypothetical protein